MCLLTFFAESSAGEQRPFGGPGLNSQPDVHTLILDEGARHSQHGENDDTNAPTVDNISVTALVILDDFGSEITGCSAHRLHGCQGLI